MVWDANYIQDMQRFDTHGCSRMFDHENGAESVWPLELNEGVFMPMYREQGLVVRADTIEELAEKLGLPVDNFKATVERYNELYDKQDDEDFGKPAYRLSSLRTAPYYGYWLGACLLTTEQGILCDAKARVKSADGGIIENLYVCGDNAGGFFYNNYPCVMPGIAMGRNMTFAIKAVKMAFGEDA
jgi:hypothetical protein